MEAQDQIDDKVSGTLPTSASSGSCVISACMYRDIL
jgi:hypothetical protein